MLGDRYKHKGNFFEVLHIAYSKVPFHRGENIVVYRDEDGQVFARFLEEFKSKFEPVREG
ncbi:hypothetical protein DT065_00305 [Salicibibacter kimchii]|uniref:DUF1653 domain-containing protein n=1 Tax=Salicibibacter kimchii TaxID=2099786 RepID=A0A345BUH6_9BACI|nr:hypothetical protein DT065_00305 [Salicibibacter kimchii]